MIEKRRTPRLSVNLPVILRHQGRLIPATALNISCGGMSIRAEDTEITSESPVEIIFDIGEIKDISLRGQVTRIDSATQETVDLGLRFTNLFSIGHKTVEEYVRKNLN